MTEHAEAMELCKTIAHNMGRLSGIAEQLYHHASGEMETDVAVRRDDSMEAPIKKDDSEEPSFSLKVGGDKRIRTAE